MKSVALLTLIGLISLATPAIAAEPALSHYRGVTLGESLQVVVQRLQLATSDVKVLHEGPALVQEVTWRPRLSVSGTTTEAESVAEMVLTFHADRLARITVNYDRMRTQGLTNADLLEAMGYGTTMLIATPTQPSTAPARQTVGQWEDPDTLVVLWREQFPNRIGLTITSIAADPVLQQAIADGVRLTNEGAPARELARRAAEAAAIQARDEKIRLENKTKFKP